MIPNNQYYQLFQGKHRWAPTEEEYHAGGNVSLSPPRGRQRRTDVGNLTPIERDKRHPKARNGPKQLIDDDVLRGNPTNPVRKRKGSENVAREEIPAE